MASKKNKAKKAPRPTKRDHDPALQVIDANAASRRDPPPLKIPVTTPPRPTVEREEARHEYSATGLDGSPRTPVRKSVRPKPRTPAREGDVQENRISGSPCRTSLPKMATDSPHRDDATAAAPGDKTYAAALVEDTPETLTNGSGPMVNGVNGHAAEDEEKGSGEKDDKEYQLIPENGLDAEQMARELDKRNGYQAGGIRFAPWNIPVKRRFQTLAVLLHSLSIAILMSIFFFLCAIPLNWPILIPYLIHVLFSDVATDGRLRYRSERLRHLRVWSFFANYFPAKLHKTHDLPPTRKYIFGYHPHGIISHGAFAAFATESLGFSEKFPGITNSLLTLDSNFRMPFYRDYLLAMGLRSVSKESIGNILTRGGPNNEGMGRAVTIVVGGARESLEAQPGTLHLILKERKGFIKLAVRTGADLVPVLAFGENDLYDQVSPKSHPTIRRLQMFALRTMKFTLPFLHGRGIFNYDVGLMPYRRPLNIVVGRPIKVAQATARNVEAGEVDRLHELYVAELEKIWDTYKDEFAKDRTEEMQLYK